VTIAIRHLSLRFTALTKLQVLWLEGTKVTDAGVNELQRALPSCTIVR
jgi:hypothetical protein